MLASQAHPAGGPSFPFGKTFLPEHGLEWQRLAIFRRAFRRCASVTIDKMHLSAPMAPKAAV